MYDHYSCICQDRLADPAHKHTNRNVADPRAHVHPQAVRSGNTGTSPARSSPFSSYNDRNVQKSVTSKGGSPQTAARSPPPHSSQTTRHCHNPFDRNRQSGVQDPEIANPHKSKSNGYRCHHYLRASVADDSAWPNTRKRRPFAEPFAEIHPEAPTRSCGLSGCSRENRPEPHGDRWAIAPIGHRPP
ncbi:hypothetical protein D3C76_747170 [compost metagenome]